MLLQRFRSLAASDPEAPALTEGATGAVTTRSALIGLASDTAKKLSHAGVEGGDLIAIQLPNSPEFVASWLAALELSLVVIPIDRDAPQNEVSSILGHFDACALVSKSGIQVRETRQRSILPRDARLVKLTSGSTGKPKGIVTSAANLAADAAHICSTMGILPGDINLGAIPFSHSYGFSNLVSPLLTQGTAIVISNDYLPLSILDLCNRHRCTVMPGIPMMFDHLASMRDDDGSFTSVRTFLSAGAPLPATTSRRFRERFGIPIHTFYGCSECGGISYDRAGAAVERGTAGTAMDGVQVSLEQTRVTVTSDAVALGYLHDAETFEPFTRQTFTTDDLAEIRSDGEIEIIGRSSELINTAGKKVNPREIEEVILQIEGVRQVKVYGEPAGARGEVVAAAVVASPEVTREMIRDHCRAHLSLNKVPRIVKLIESIPVDERGKVKRAALIGLGLSS
ncbi:MAG: acyl--CoA ligase [Thermoanaerobaculia bacterium]|nr:acyl--CoA ligase [Thermoanaerobaculia bacterium]